MPKTPWLEGSSLGMTNSYWMVIGTVAAIGAASELANRAPLRFGGSNVDAQEYWNSLTKQQAAKLLKASTGKR